MIIYQAKTKDNEIYIGQALSLKKRIRVHKCHFKNPNKYVSPFHGKIKNFDDIEFSEIDKCDNRFEADRRETCWIAILKADNKIILNTYTGNNSKRRSIKDMDIKLKRKNQRMINSLNQIMSPNWGCPKKSQKNSVISGLKNRGTIKVLDRSNKKIIFEGKKLNEVAEFLDVGFQSVSRYLKKQRRHEKYDFYRGEK